MKKHILVIIVKGLKYQFMALLVLVQRPVFCLLSSVFCLLTSLSQHTYIKGDG